MPKFCPYYVALILSLLMPTMLLAAPQAQPGDIGLRHDIQLLADYGAISGPVTAWPIAWDAVLSDLENVKATNVVLPNNVLPTFDRIFSRALRETRRGVFTYNGHLSVAEEPTNIRGFSDTPRDRGGIRAAASWFSEHFSIDVNASVVDEPFDGKEFHADGSQIAVDIGNWSVAASTMNRWWGPGWDGSLILSNNARPIPALTIARNRTHSFESKWLSWIGPWDMNVIFGQLEKERATPNARFFGMRVNFRPLDSLEIGLSRAAQWCGDGRPCGFDVLTDLLLGKDNVGDAGTTLDNEPGNQLAGFDIRWTNFWAGVPISVYGQLIGEDEAGGFPSRYLAQFGVEGSGISRGQHSYRWFAEAAGTSCDVLKNTVGYNCAYNNRLYPSGYTYRGRVIGHGLDNDAVVVSAGVIVVDAEGNTWQILGRIGDLNRVGPEADHSVATVPQELASIDFQHSRATGIGRFDFGLGFERREIMATGVNTEEARGFVRWSSR